MKLTTPEDIATAPAGFIGIEADGTIVTRAIEGPGAVWRRMAKSGNVWPEDIKLPVTALLPVGDDAQTQWAVRVEDPRWDKPVYRERPDEAGARQHAEAVRSEYGHRRVTATLVIRDALHTEWRDAPTIEG